MGTRRYSRLHEDVPTTYFYTRAGSDGCLGDELCGRCEGGDVILDAKDFERRHSLSSPQPGEDGWLKLKNVDIKLVLM